MIVQHLSKLLLADAGVIAVFADRVYPIEAPDAPTYPMAILAKVSGIEAYDTSGPAGLENGRVQIDVFTDQGYSALIVAKDAIKSVLAGFHGPVESSDVCVIDSCMCINDFDMNETSTERAGPRLRRRVLEFRVFSKES